MRWLGLWAVLAALLGRGLAPALRGLGPGWLVGAVEWAAGVISQGLLLALVAALVVFTTSMLRLPRLPMAYRMLVTALGGIALGLAVPSGVARLAPEFSVALAVVASVAALAGAAQAASSRDTRILGVLMGLVAVGTLTRQAAWGLTVIGGNKALLRVALAGRWVAGGALLIQVVLVTAALLWLATRRRKIMSLSTTLCSALAMGVAWCAERLEAGQALSSWQAVVARAGLLQLSAPVPPAPQGVRVFLGAVALLLGLVAVGHRREPPAVVGTLALVLVAGLDLDVPLCALGITVGALTSTLAAHDPETGRHAIRFELRPPLPRTAVRATPHRAGRSVLGGGYAIRTEP